MRKMEFELADPGPKRLKAVCAIEVDVLTEHGAQARQDAHELYRRMVLNVLISNDDDHLRNHGFLWTGPRGWVLSPVYDLNPTPVDVRPRILSTSGKEGGFMVWPPSARRSR